MNKGRTNSLRDELIWGLTLSDDKGWCTIVPLNSMALIDIFNKKIKCWNYRCPDSVILIPRC